MALCEKMSTVAILVVVYAFAGVCYGAEKDKDCSTNQAEVFSKMVKCITKNHPEYFVVVLTKMPDPKAMESPDFMCSEQGLMTAAAECLMQYMEGCLPSSVARQAMDVMPTHDTIRKGIKFLCDHRQDFDDPCVKSHLMELGQCISNKMQTYSRVTRSANPNMRDALCYALDQEKQCLDSSLKGCAPHIVADIKKALQSFFPSDRCPRTLPRSEVLLFQSEGRGPY